MRNDKWREECVSERVSERAREGEREREREREGEREKWRKRERERESARASDLFKRGACGVSVKRLVLIGPKNVRESCWNNAPQLQVCVRHRERLLRVMV